MFNLKRKVLFGVSVSMVLAMAVGSFAIGDNQTPANPQMQTSGAVNAPDSGAFTITATDGETVLTDNDYSYSGGILTIKSTTPMTIKNTNTGSTTDRIVIGSNSLAQGDTVKLTLAGVNISTSTGSALRIKDDATFNVNITLADNSENTLTATADNYAGLQKNGNSGVGMLTISGSTGEKAGKLTAIGGRKGAGIGGGNQFSGSYITITGGTVTATGGQYGAGIGGGYGGSGDTITITGGTVTATGGDYAAGIGGGRNGSGSKIEISGGEVEATGGSDGAGIGGGDGSRGVNITISGGVVTATGGFSPYGGGAGIGGGINGSASDNKLDGDAVVMAASGGDGKDALEGFVDSQGGSLITRGIVFTGVVTDYTTDPYTIDWEKGEQYGNVTITEDTTFPADFKITSDAALTIGKNADGKEATLSMAEGKKLTVEGSLTNEGVIDIPAEYLACGEDNGEITTLLNYDPQGGTIKTNEDNYITYQDVNGTKKYENLPEATKEGYDLDGWYTEKEGKGTKIEDSSNVLLNQHILYANWVESEPPTPTPPTPTPPGPEPQPTPPGPQPGPEPEPTPTPEPTPDPSVDPDGDGSGSSSKTSDPFMGGVALALLGVATTGAILTRKLR